MTALLPINMELPEACRSGLPLKPTLVLAMLLTLWFWIQGHSSIRLVRDIQLGTGLNTMT